MRKFIPANVRKSKPALTTEASRIFPSGISLLHGLDWFRIYINLNRQISSITIKSQRKEQKQQDGF